MLCKLGLWVWVCAVCAVCDVCVCVFVAQCVCCLTEGLGSTVAVLSEYWHTTPRVLVDCPSVLAQYSKEYWHSTARVVVQYSQRAGRGHP